jgi:hypothetical protein
VGQHINRELHLGGDLDDDGIRSCGTSPCE